MKQLCFILLSILFTFSASACEMTSSVSYDNCGALTLPNLYVDYADTIRHTLEIKL
ncbi:hypothetical protein [Pontibacter harenae]|uniref:hypothetical protein n=1 Tax=Pontibacter harenae TaxID=2894083 RepID=UPI001E313854|nr:hypothetical protein [Pontibacter harenae]MCC9168022.1 hypothetical protein [Pontibacter harenae]